MPRLIDADAFRNEWLEDGENEYVYDTNAVLDSIDRQPTIDAEPVRHGRWEWHEEWGPPTWLDPPDLYDTYWICSACGTDLLQYLKSHFPDIPSYTECSEEVPTLERCPCCGAKMDGGTEDGET